MSRIPLVVIGDSLSQGFQSGSITRTHWSYPAMIARAIGVDSFQYPDFSQVGGLPLNLEEVLRRLEQAHQRLEGEGRNPSFFKQLSIVNGYLDEVEDYWESREARKKQPTGPVHHNLAVWGFDLLDSTTLSAKVCESHLPLIDFFDGPMVSEPMYRTAMRTLNPQKVTSQSRWTQLDSVAHLASEAGGIETLVYFLGSNNCLGTLTSLSIVPSADRDLYSLSHQREANFWLPHHFNHCLDRALEQLDTIDATRVIVGTIPYVSIAPIARGVSTKDYQSVYPEGRDKRGYYEYYTHFWVWDDDFRQRPQRYPYLTRDHIMTIEDCVDRYNEKIRKVAQERGWDVFDANALLSSMAFRRNAGRVTYVFPQAFKDALKRNPATAHRVLEDGSVLMDARYLGVFEEEADPTSRWRGGFFSLDGIHPTTVGYAIIAYELLTLMGQEHKATDAWWDEAVAADTLLTDMPETLHRMRDWLGWLGTTALYPILRRFLLNF